MTQYNLTITFMISQLKTEYLANIDSSHIKEDDLGLTTYIPGKPTVFYPWTAIAKFEKERAQ